MSRLSCVIDAFFSSMRTATNAPSAAPKLIRETGARGRGSRWRRAPNARSAKEAFALGRGGRHRGRGRRGGGSTCEKVVPGVLRPTRCLAASAIAQKGRKRSGVQVPGDAPFAKGQSGGRESPSLRRGGVVPPRVSRGLAFHGHADMLTWNLWLRQ